MGCKTLTQLVDESTEANTRQVRHIPVGPLVVKGRQWAKAGPLLTFIGY